MANIERKTRVTTRPTQRRPEEYRSSLLDMLGLSSPFEHAVTQVRTDVAIERPALGESWESPFPRITELPRSAGPEPDTETQGLVQRLWQASEVTDQDLVIEDWGPEAPADRAVGRYRWAWWPVLLGALIIGSVLVITGLRGIPAGQADEIRVEWATTAAQLQATLPDARAAAAIVTNPGTGPEGLSQARVSMATFNNSAGALEVLVSRPFPTPPPLASGDAFDPLKPAQTELTAGANLAADIEDRLADAITYRNLLDQAFLMPPLPIVADDVTRADLAVQIAAAVSSSREAVRQLPIGPSFSAHRDRALALVSRFDTWQASYLDALRLSDIDAATNLKVEISERIATLRNTVNEPLGLVASSVTESFDILDELLSDSIVSLTAE